MVSDRARSWILTVSTPLLVAALASGLVRAAQNSKFKDAQRQLWEQNLKAQKEQHLDADRAELFRKYPTPEIGLFKIQKVAPGSSLALSLGGKFPPGTAVLSERDGAALAAPTVAASSITARLTVAPGELPGYVRLYALTPVSNGTAWLTIAFVDAVNQFDLKAANGWTVKAVPTSATFTLGDREATLEYRVEFYKPGETKAFETRVGSMRFSPGDEPLTRLDISLGEQKGAAEAELNEIAKKMSDMQAFMRMTEAQQEALVNRMATLQQQQMEEMMATMADPAAAQKKEDDFGCRLLQVYPGQGTAVEGNVLCGRNFNDGMLRTTGTRTPAKPVR